MFLPDEWGFLRKIQTLRLMPIDTLRWHFEA